MKNINQTVGLGGINNPQDVSIVQELLKQQGAKNLKVDGLYGPNTLKAIKEFQSRFLKSPDGMVSPGKKTIQSLNASPGTIPSSPSPPPKERGTAHGATRGAVYPQIVTIEMLDVVNPEGKGKNRANVKILPYLNKYIQEFHISNQREIVHMLSQMHAESRLKPVREDMNYRPKTMRKIFGCAYNTRGYDIKTDDCKPGYKKIRPKLWTEEKKYAHNPRNLGNYVYSNRMSNGNEKSGDGFNFRASGAIQLTGKNNYQAVQNELEKLYPQDNVNIVKNPDLVADSGQYYEYSIRAAFVFWVKVRNVGRTASRDNSSVRSVTLLVNSGLNGYKERLNAFNRLARYLEIPETKK